MVVVVVVRLRLLWAPVELGVLDESVPVGEPGPALRTAVCLLALDEEEQIFQLFIVQVLTMLQRIATEKI